LFAAKLSSLVFFCIIARITQIIVLIFYLLVSAYLSLSVR